MKHTPRLVQRLARAASVLLLAVLAGSCVFALAAQGPPGALPPAQSAAAPAHRPAQTAPPVPAAAAPTQAPIPEALVPGPEETPAPAAAAPQGAAGALPAVEPVGDEWFTDAAFVGDSRTEGLLLYSGVKPGGAFAHRGLTVQSARTDRVIDAGGGKKTAVEALGAGTFGKVYLMLGVNELGWYNDRRYYENYADLIDMVRKVQPKAQIYLQTLIPVAAEHSAPSYVNNPQILAYNEIIARLAEEKGIYLVDVWAEFAGADGALDPAGSADGVHLSREYCRRWLDYLTTHTARE